MTKSFAPGLALVAFSWPFIAGALDRPDLSRTEALVVDGVNELRRTERLPRLERDNNLEAAARAFAAFMARTGKFSHEADGSTPSARARVHGYDFCLVAENIAYFYSSDGYPTADLARRLVEGWKNSPGHRTNMLGRDAIHTAVAVAHSARKGVQHYYAVHMFGRPRSARVEFQVSNASAVFVKYRVAERAFSLQPRAIRTHTECSAQSLTFEIPEEASSRGRQFTTRSGDKFVVAREKGQLSVKRD